MEVWNRGSCFWFIFFPLCVCAMQVYGYYSIIYKCLYAYVRIYLLLVIRHDFSRVLWGEMERGSFQDNLFFLGISPAMHMRRFSIQTDLISLAKVAPTLLLRALTQQKNMMGEKHKLPIWLPQISDQHSLAINLQM